MKLPFLTLFLIFIIYLTIQLKRTSRDQEKSDAEFWKREHDANFVRKKNIDNLPYIPFDIAQLPLHNELNDIHIAEYIEELSAISGAKILNSTGKSNTDLKLEYGTANITKLTEYDNNYTILVRNIARLAEKYLIHSSIMLQNISADAGNQDSNSAASNAELSAILKADAIQLLEYGISIGTDVRLNYELLSEIYADTNSFDKIAELKTAAASLNSLNKAPILRHLEKYDSIMDI